MASTGSGVAESMAMILARPPKQGFSQAAANILVVYKGFGQALGAVVKFAKVNQCAQARAEIRQTYTVSAQAQAFVTI